MRKTTWLVRAFALGLGLTAAGCGTDIFKHTKGTTYGDITVSDARVSSRERLVNDRLVQDAWLKEQLTRSDQQDFGFQGAADLRSFVGASTRLEANTNQVELDRYRAQAGQSADAARKQQEQADLDNQLQRQYKQRQLEAMNLQPGTSFTYTPPTAKLDAPPAPTAPSAPATVDDLRKLKDDFGKFTIDPSTIKFPDKLKASPQEMLRDKLEYRGLIRTEILDNALDDRHDLKGNSLLRFDIDAQVRPDDDTSAWAVINVEIDTGKWYDRCVSEGLYEKWRVHVERELRERTALLIRNGNEAGRASEREEGSKATQAQRDLAFLQGMVAFLPEYLSLEIQHDWLTRNGYAPYWTIVLERAKGRLSKDKPTREDLRQQMYIEISAAHYRLLERLLPKFVTPEFGNNVRALKVQKKKDSTTVADDFCAALHKRAEIYAYSVTPKESVQRVAEVASRRNVSEFMLALSFLGGNSAAGKLYGDYMKVNEGIFQAIHRQPLVVGYSKGTRRTAADAGAPPAGAEKTACDAEAKTRRVERCMSFGWILGPRFAIKNDGSGSNYRHTVEFNPLSSVISIPGWVSDLEVKVRTHWVNDDGFIPAKKTESILPVSLKPDYAAITDALAEESIREPRPFTRPILEYDEGAAATFVIPGQNLWRNPVVLLGSQQADEVSVLPDMRGLVAKFRELKLQRPKGSEEMEVLSVWTSEGNAEAGLVKIKPAKAAPAAAADPKATLASNAAFPNRLLEIGLAPAQKSFFGMNVFFGSLGTSEHKTGEIARLFNDGATASVKTPAFPKMKSGDELLLQVAVKSAPDIRPAQPFGGPITAIYYKTEDEAKAKLNPAQVTLKALADAAFTVSFPLKTGIAYPGSDAEKLTVVLDLKGGKGPAAAATPCARDSTKKTPDQCGFGVKLAAVPDADVEYAVKVMAGDKPLPVSPATIKIVVKDASKAPIGKK